MLPASIVPLLQAHLSKVRTLHRADLKDGYGEVALPFALARKYPRAAREWGWQFVFPSVNRSLDPRSGLVRRHHVSPNHIQRAVKTAIRLAHLIETAVATPFVIASRRTCWKTDMTSGPFRSYWDIRTCGRR